MRVWPSLPIRPRDRGHHAWSVVHQRREVQVPEGDARDLGARSCLGLQQVLVDMGLKRFDGSVEPVWFYIVAKDRVVSSVLAYQ